MTKKKTATTSTDPYATLGVERTATKDEIKKAYYEHAKQHHPDAGGSSEDFLPVKLAYETLIDDEKRAFFDQFGAMPDSAEANEIQAACQGLSQFFMELLQNISPETLKALDVVGCLRDRIVSEQKKSTEGLKVLEQREKKLQQTAEILAAKLKSSDPKQPNVFQDSVQAALSQCAAQRTAVEASISIQNRALEMLKCFTFDFEKEPMPSFGFRGTVFTTSTTVNW